MPDLAGVDLEARVVALVEARRPMLAELVRLAVDRDLEALVALEVESRNGSTSEVRTLVNAIDQSRRCRICERDLPISKFEPHRHQCRACRNEQARRRAATSGTARVGQPRPGADEGDVPRPGLDAQPG